MSKIFYNVPLAIAVVVGLSAGPMTPSAALAQMEPADNGSENSASTKDGPPEFTSVFGEPLNVGEPMEDESFTAAVEEFHATGKNPYVGDEAAIAEGEDLFAQECSACHGRTGSGGMGPSLVDDTYANERAATEHGIFEIIYGGAAGAMPTFANQIEQDQILEIMAYIGSLNDN